MKKSQRGTPRRRKRARVKKHAAAHVAIRRPVMTLEPSPAATLTNDPLMVSTFIGTLTLDDRQKAALRRPVTDDEIEWKAAVRDGEAIIPYLSHNGYRDRLDDAFGLGGWGMVPVGMPKEKADAVFVPYAMVIGGVPRIYTWGEQEQHKMSYGDALEGAKSNAIVRCGKELGIARELWNRGHVAELLARARLKRGPRQQGEDPKHRYGSDAKAAEPITDQQRIRLWTIVKRTGRPKTEVAMWLTARYNIEDSHTIKRRDYDAIVTAIENPGPLPMPEEA